jgi:hypothetical protein
MFLISAPKGFEIIILLIAIGCFILPVAAILDIIRKDGVTNDKIFWVLIIIFLPVIGSLAYFYNRDNLNRP